MLPDVPTNIAVLALGMHAALLLVAAFVHCERRGRPEIPLACVLAAVVGQVVFYAGDSSVPNGVFRPGPVRVHELLILAAVGAWLWVRGPVLRWSRVGLAWFAFLSIYGVAGVVGFLAGHSSDVVLVDGKLLVYAGGCYVLAAGVPPNRLLHANIFGSWLLVLSGIVVAQSIVSEGDLKVPLVSDLGADASSLYLGIAIVVALVEATRRTPRAWVYLAAAPLAFNAVFVHQRASVVHLGATLLLLLVAAVLSAAARRRFAPRPTHFALAVTAVGVTAIALSLPSVSSGEAATPIVADALDATFGGVGNEYSAEARLFKWDEGWRLFWEHPVFGGGLGSEFVSFRPGIDGVGVFEQKSVFDNILFDLVVRSGIVGFVLFVAAVGLSLRSAWRSWQYHDDSRLAALALGAAVFITGLMVKGLVESVLNKVTLSCMFGIAAGVIAAVASDSTAGDGTVYGAEAGARRDAAWS